MWSSKASRTTSWRSLRGWSRGPTARSGTTSRAPACPRRRSRLSSRPCAPFLNKILDSVTITKRHYWPNASWGVMGSLAVSRGRGRPEPRGRTVARARAMKMLGGQSSPEIATIAISLTCEANQARGWQGVSERDQVRLRHQDPQHVPT